MTINKNELDEAIKCLKERIKALEDKVFHKPKLAELDEFYLSTNRTKASE